MLKIKKITSFVLLALFVLTACGNTVNEEDQVHSDEDQSQANLYDNEEAVSSEIEEILNQLADLDETSLDDLLDWFEAGGSDKIVAAFPHFPHVILDSFDEDGNLIYLEFIASELEIEFLYWEFRLDRDFYTNEGHFIEGEALVFYDHYRIFNIEGIPVSSEDELIGSWTWSADEEWVYVFHPDGSGERGLDYDKRKFTWELTSESELLIETTSQYDDREISERWLVRLDEEGTLLLQSLHIVGMVHHYSFVE